MAERTALVTGCSSGFGRAVVDELLGRGWTVLATVRRAAEAAPPAALAAASAAHPGRLHVLSLELADPRERRAVAEAVGTRPAGLDCLVNNAGYALLGALEDVSEAQLRQQLEVNFLGTALLTRDLLPALRRARGRVINVSSMLGATGLPLMSAYCASKFALEGWTEALRHELRPHGVRVALVQPGGHRTRFAENAVWGEGVARADSPYTRQSAGYRRLEARLTSRPGVGPEAVARVIARLAAADRLPLRVRVGRDARLLHAVHRLLPEWLAMGLIAATVARLFRESPRDQDRPPRHVAEPPWI